MNTDNVVLPFVDPRINRLINEMVEAIKEYKQEGKMNIEQRKAQLRAFVEAREKATQGEWHEVDGERILVSLDLLPDKASGLLAEVYDPAKPKETHQTYTTQANAEFICLAANQSALIAKQLIQAIAVIEKLNEACFDGHQEMSALNKGAGFSDGPAVEEHLRSGYDLGKTFLAQLGDGEVVK